MSSSQGAGHPAPLPQGPRRLRARLGTVPNFTECFIGEDNDDPTGALRIPARNDFDGFLLDDHVLHMDDDSDWNHRGRAPAIGYMQGLLRMGDILKAA